MARGTREALVLWGTNYECSSRHMYSLDALDVYVCLKNNQVTHRDIFSFLLSLLRRGKLGIIMVVPHVMILQMVLAQFKRRAQQALHTAADGDIRNGTNSEKA